jgi:hypothetical protein
VCGNFSQGAGTSDTGSDIAFSQLAVKGLILFRVEVDELWCRDFTVGMFCMQRRSNTDWSHPGTSSTARFGVSARETTVGSWMRHPQILHTHRPLPGCHSTHPGKTFYFLKACTHINSLFSAGNVRTCIHQPSLMLSMKHFTSSRHTDTRTSCTLNIVIAWWVKLC